jgi:biopolymer transport protein ExbD
MKVNRQIGKKARIEMLPLIDIVFLLLVFFIYAMLSMAVHHGLPVILPTSSTSGIEKKLVLAVTVKDDGAVYVNETPVPLKELAAYLKIQALQRVQPGVLLFADRRLSYQRLFQVLDQIRVAGIQRISLQSELEASP